MSARDQITSHGFHPDSPERRRARRSLYAATVGVESERAWGWDISALGLAVEMAQLVQIGDVVHVTLSPGSLDGALAEIGASARVVRLDPASRGVRVALQFLDSDQS
jgi:PilZ domain-containing protein